MIAYAFKFLCLILKLHVQIHPPYADTLVEAIKNLLTQLSAEKIKGLIVLQKTGHIRIIE